MITHHFADYKLFACGSAGFKAVDQPGEHHQCRRLGAKDPSAERDRQNTRRLCQFHFAGLEAALRSDKYGDGASLFDPLDEASGSLGHVNEILGDVSSMSSAPSAVADSVKNVAVTAANSVATAVNRITGRAARSSAAALAESTGAEPESTADPIPPAPKDNGYVTYGPKNE